MNSIFKMRKWKLGEAHLPEITHIVDGGAGIQSQACLS